MAEHDNPTERTFTLFNHLPLEIQTNIFGHLDLQAKGRAARVCKTWRDVIYNKSLWRDVKAHIILRRRHCNTHLLTSLTARGIRRVQVIGRFVRGIPRVQVNGRYGLSDLITYMPNLQSLDLFSCSRDLINPALVSAFGHHPLPHLTRLNLYDCPLLDDQSVAVLAVNCVNLTDLDLGRCSRLTNKSLLHVGRHLAALTRLVVNHCEFTDVGIAYLTGSDSDEPTTGNVRLEHLELNFCHRLFDKTLRLVAERLPGLTFLDISHLTNITEAGFGQLARLVSLRELRAKWVNARDAWLVHLVDTNIKILDLGSNNELTGQGLAQLIRMCRLQQLDLTSCNGVTDFNFLVESSVAILRLQFSDKLTDVGLFQLARMTNLSELNLSYCSAISDDGLISLADGVTKLTSLDLSSNSQITDVGVHHLSRLPLRKLDLSYCHKITDTGMGHLVRMVDLRNLDMEHCTVSDAGLAILAEGTANLAVLKLARCQHITDDGLPYLAKMANLKYVSLNGCRGITSAGVADLVRRAPGIATVDFS